METSKKGEYGTLPLAYPGCLLAAELNDPVHVPIAGGKPLGLQEVYE
jgi:hypothetical protein